MPGIELSLTIPVRIAEPDDSAPADDGAPDVDTPDNGGSGSPADATGIAGTVTDWLLPLGVIALGILAVSQEEE